MPRSLSPEQGDETPQSSRLHLRGPCHKGSEAPGRATARGQDSDGPYGDTASGLQGSNGDSAPGRPSAPEPELNPAPGKLTGSSREGLLRATGSPSDPPTSEQMVMDTSPDLIMKYGKRVPEKRA